MAAGYRRRKGRTMHPVTSDLDLMVRQYEREREIQAIRRDGIARNSTRAGDRVGLVTRMTQTIRQFLDPRGFALAQAGRISRATAEAASANPTTATIRVLAQPVERAAESWREAA